MRLPAPPPNLKKLNIMTIDEAIEARYARFDRMYQKAVGHTFREDPVWCEEQTKKEMEEWQPKMDAFLKEKGFTSEDEYFEHLLDTEQEDSEFRTLCRERPSYSSLYDYECLVINQAKSIVDFLSTINDNIMEAWKSLGENTSDFEFIKNLKKAGYTEWDEGHSGNSAGQSILFANVLCSHPDWFPYLHGALTPLVGDEGYHDTRDDIPENL